MVEPFDGEAAPFLAGPILAIDIDDDGDTEEPDHAAEDGISHAADVDDIRLDEGKEEAGDERVDEGIEGFAAEGAEANDAHASVGLLAQGDEGVAIEDGDQVPALCKAGAELLDEGLEPAVCGRDAAGAEEGDVQFPGDHYRMSSPAESQRPVFMHRSAGAALQ